MKHAFIMNCHRDLAQAAISAPLYHRYWAGQSDLYFYYDGPPDYDPTLMATVQNSVTRIWTGPYEAHKSRSIFNAVNVLADQAAARGVDVVSFVHADMIPLFRTQFYGFIDRFWQSGKIMTYSKMWPTADYIDFTNLHFRLADAYAHKLLPIHKLAAELDFNEAEATLSFDRACPGLARPGLSNVEHDLADHQQRDHASGRSGLLPSSCEQSWP